MVDVAQERLLKKLCYFEEVMTDFCFYNIVYLPFTGSSQLIAIHLVTIRSY